MEAKRRILEKIEADKAERKAKAERERAAREGRAVDSPLGGPAASAPAAPKANLHTEARLRLQTPNGNIMKTFPADTTLFEVAQAVQSENGTQVSSFTSNYPKKIYDATDFGMTLKEAGLAPSAALIVR